MLKAALVVMSMGQAADWAKGRGPNGPIFPRNARLPHFKDICSIICACQGFFGGGAIPMVCTKGMQGSHSSTGLAWHCPRLGPDPYGNCMSQPRLHSIPL